MNHFLITLLSLLNLYSSKYRISTIKYLPLGDEDQSSVVNALNDKKWELMFDGKNYDRIHVYFDLQDPFLITSTEILVEKECGRIDKITLSFSQRINGHYSDPVTINCTYPETSMKSKIRNKSQFIKMEIFRKSAVDVKTFIRKIAFYTNFDKRQIININATLLPVIGENNITRATKIIFEHNYKVKMAYFKREKNGKENKKLEDNFAIKVGAEGKDYMAKAVRVKDEFYRIVLPGERIVKYFESEVMFNGPTHLYLYEMAPTHQVTSRKYKLSHSARIDLGRKYKIRKIKLLEKTSSQFMAIQKNSIGFNLKLFSSVDQNSTKSKRTVYNQNSDVLETFFPGQFLWMTSKNIAKEIYALVDVKAKRDCKIDEKTKEKFGEIAFQRDFFVNGEKVLFDCKNKELEGKKMFCRLSGNGNGEFVLEDNIVVTSSKNICY